MRLLTIILLLLPMIANAQSQIPRALSEPLNLAPRCQRGDAQKLLLEVDYLFLDETGMITSIKKSSLQYTVLCLENTVGEKVVWEAAIDSFKIGSKAAPGSKATRHRVMTELEGYSFDIIVTKKVPVRDGCYDFGIPIEENLHYTEGFEFLTMIIPLKIIEQLRFTAGRRLGLIGDTL
ncbi:MAG: hypothetical protein KAT58_03235, partial [candidate division Zixibacteria bacterium]|nr:hypothetical protein [candidate division Zixibacteria bacterium]